MKILTKLKKVAKKCLELDKAKKLGRTGGIW